MSVDWDFASIERPKRKKYKFSTPSDYLKLIKDSHPNNPFKIVYVEHSLTDDLTSDGTDV